MRNSIRQSIIHYLNDGWSDERIIKRIMGTWMKGDKLKYRDSNISFIKREIEDIREINELREKCVGMMAEFGSDPEGNLYHIVDVEDSRHLTLEGVVLFDPDDEDSYEVCYGVDIDDIILKDVSYKDFLNGKGV